MPLLEMAVLACSLIIFQLYGQHSFNGAWDGWLGTGAQRRYVMCHTPECALFGHTGSEGWGFSGNLSVL